MSIAGVRSNRGDIYQTAVALDWAVRALADERIEWLELDSTSIIPGGELLPVDDIVVRYRDGSSVCCQCKKNQTNFEAWTVSGLAGELTKAAKLLVRDSQATVHFYSRADFGELAKLREYATSTADLASYEASLPEVLKKADAALAALWAPMLTDGALTRDALLRRIKFQLTPDHDGLREEALLRLKQLASRATDAFNALWTKLDQLGAHVAGPQSNAVADTHRVSRAELQAIVQAAGSTLGVPPALQDIERAFTEISSIGRSWRRDILGETFDRAAKQEVLDALASGCRTILLTDGPGSGKTCVLLGVIEELERTPQARALYIQAREFADARNVAERVSRGLRDDIPLLVSTMSETRQVVVIIDSLDVLSLAREHESLSYFLGLIDRLSIVPNVSVIAACRNFDLKYDRRLADRSWDKTISLGLLDWQNAVAPLLRRWSLEPDSLDQISRELLRNPRNLAIFADLAERGLGKNVSSSQELTEAYLDAVVRADPQMGDSAMAAIETMAGEMLANRVMELPRGRIQVEDSVLGRLLSANVLFSGRSGGITFGHQTLLDALAVRDAERKGLTLRDFVDSLPAVPFVRPAIRAFLSHLRLGDQRTFRSQVRALLDADVAFHIKRLVAESLGGITPADDDWRLIQHIFQNHEPLFRFLYAAAEGPEWHAFWMRHLVPLLVTSRNVSWLSIHVRRISTWRDLDPQGVINFWKQVLEYEWIQDEYLPIAVGMELGNFKDFQGIDAAPLLDLLISKPRQQHDFLGRVLQNFVKTTNSGDELLWRYIAGGVQEEHLRSLALDRTLRSGSQQFEDDSFLTRRLTESPSLLSLAVSTLQRWGEQQSRQFGIEPAWNNAFLQETTYGQRHSTGEDHHISEPAALVRAIERAVVKQAQANSQWWIEHKAALCANPTGALRYIAMQAIIAEPQLNADIAEKALTEQRFLGLTEGYELSRLVSAVFYYMPEAAQDQVAPLLTAVNEEQCATYRNHVLQKRYSVLSAIPAPSRSPAVVAQLECLSREFPIPPMQPDIHWASGWMQPPFGSDDIRSLSDAALLKLLVSSSSLERGHSGISLVGGAEQVGSQLREAASRDPSRFLKLLSESWSAIPDRFREAIFEGVIDHLRYTKGNVQPGATNWQPHERPDSAALAAGILDELERHQFRWAKTMTGATALNAVAHAFGSASEAERLTFYAAQYLAADDPEEWRGAESDLITVAINSARGEAADALMVLANALTERDVSFPELLGPVLRQFARDEHAAVRAAVLHRLPYLQAKKALGWELFELALAVDEDRIWPVAEPCLYYTYHAHFSRISPYLVRIKQASDEKARATWGRISALATLSGHIEPSALLADLTALGSEGAWRGAIDVWTANATVPQHRDTCLNSISAALEQPLAYPALATSLHALFERSAPATPVPRSLLERIFDGRLQREGQAFNIHGFDEWLSSLADTQATIALDAAEVFAGASKSGRVLLYDFAPLARLLTSLFREAEESEEADGGSMLRRVISVQDAFLQAPYDGLAAWLRDAERPER